MEIIPCPICGERKKDRNSKVYFDPNLSKKSKGIMIYICTNHPGDQVVHFSREIFYVKNVIVSVRQYVWMGRTPKNENKKH